ncbi:MAG: transposase [Flavobacterium sp.]|jgi:putative transposase|uniref:transposase n=1 Tax=Flavobacterium sp. TaxID=239 RepID=UPI0022C6A4A5|nr:transposase [Flavobacterium sp.]MCZ8188653.1 transposase [Microcystis sp. LE19-338.1B]MCZ8297726.1 transposase [Flavobacterium sp.]
MKNRKSNRLKGYDYSKNNLYFVTICVQDRLCCFGSVVLLDSVCDLSQNQSSKEASMRLNHYGLIAQKQIEWLAQQYQYIDIHNYVIMPNHIHMIIEIDSTRIDSKGIKIKSLSSLIGAFKTTSSKLIHESGFLGFSWQRSFHDHIIRNEKSYLNISRYIDINPKNWYKDSLFYSN